MQHLGESWMVNLQLIEFYATKLDSAAELFSVAQHIVASKLIQVLYMSVQ